MAAEQAQHARTHRVHEPHTGAGRTAAGGWRRWGGARSKCVLTRATPCFCLPCRAPHKQILVAFRSTSYNPLPPPAPYPLACILFPMFQPCNRPPSTPSTPSTPAPPPTPSTPTPPPPPPPPPRPPARVRALVCGAVRAVRLAAPAGHRRAAAARSHQRHRRPRPRPGPGSLLRRVRPPAGRVCTRLPHRWAGGWRAAGWGGGRLPRGNRRRVAAAAWGAPGHAPLRFHVFWITPGHHTRHVLTSPYNKTTFPAAATDATDATDATQARCWPT